MLITLPFQGALYGSAAVAASSQKAVKGSKKKKKGEIDLSEYAMDEPEPSTSAPEPASQPADEEHTGQNGLRTAGSNAAEAAAADDSVDLDPTAQSGTKARRKGKKKVLDVSSAFAALGAEDDTEAEAAQAAAQSPEVWPLWSRNPLLAE